MKLWHEKGIQILRRVYTNVSPYNQKMSLFELYETDSFFRKGNCIEYSYKASNTPE